MFFVLSFFLSVLPTCFHKSCARQSSPVIAPCCHHRLKQLISLTESKWSEKLLLQGDSVSLTNMQVPQALQQATSRDNFPKSLFLIQGKRQWGFIPKQQEEGPWVMSCSLTVPRATMHTVLGPQMCVPCLLIYTRQDQWHSYGDLLISINWNDMQLLSNSCLLSHYCCETAARPQRHHWWRLELVQV